VRRNFARLVDECDKRKHHQDCSGDGQEKQIALSRIVRSGNGLSHG
jgi:hypothetical protein